MQSRKFWKISIVDILAAVASTVLAIMMFLMATDVIGRYFFNAPIPGGLELVEFMMAIIVPFGVAYCALHRSHVVVDMVVDRFPRSLRLLTEIITTIASVIFIGLLCWQNVLNVFETYNSKMTSAVLKLPSYPFAVPVALGMGIFALILIVHLLPGKEGR